MRSIAWSPDSKHLVAYHTRPGYDRQVNYIESSPASIRCSPNTPPSATANRAMPSTSRAPRSSTSQEKSEIELDHSLFPTAYDITSPVWWKDGRGFTFEYNQRGHQVYRVLEVDTKGKVRPLIDEVSKTFIYYNTLGEGLSAGRRYRHNINDGKEIIWASERDGWEHLYLYDGLTGKVKNQITKGVWIVRNVVEVDDAKRQIYFEAGGLVPNQDPYFVQYCPHINFDGTGLTKLTGRRWHPHCDLLARQEVLRG